MKKFRKIIQLFASITLFFGTLGGYSELINENNNNQIVYAAHHKKKRKVSKIDKNKKSKKRIQKKTRKNQIPWANVYINIPKNDQDYAVTRKAIAEWNATKVVKFNIVNNPSRAAIFVQHGNYGENGWAGLTEFKKTRMTVSLNDYILDRVDLYTGMCVAEHELGHTIGLQHNDDGPSVMNSVLDPDTVSSIQPVDIANVKKLYSLK